MLCVLSYSHKKWSFYWNHHITRKFVAMNDSIIWFFSDSHWCLFPTGSVWLELAESAAGRVVLLQLYIFTWWGSRYEGLGCHAPMLQAYIPGCQSPFSKHKNSVTSRWHSLIPILQMSCFRYQFRSFTEYHQGNMPPETLPYWMVNVTQCTHDNSQ